MQFCDFSHHRGMRSLGPLIVMIGKMIAGDLMRFCIIYVIFLMTFVQGKVTTRIGCEKLVAAHFERKTGVRNLSNQFCNACTIL